MFEEIHQTSKTNIYIYTYIVEKNMGKQQTITQQKKKTNTKTNRKEEEHQESN